jgi:type IV pilus assembly protein PilN
MRITLNLASRPYVDLRPLYTRLRLWMILLAILALPLWLLLRVEQRRASVAQAEQTILTRDMQKLKQEQQNNQVQMRQPQNAAVLAQSEFLNQLFKRKTFSWTAVMMDLETVLPSGVQVMNLEPVIAKDGQVTIRMRVNGQRDKAVELVRNLEHSRRFLAPRLAGETAETSAGGNAGSQQNLQPVSESTPVNFEILSEYNPLSRAETKQNKAKSQSSSGDSEKPKQKSKTPKAPAPNASSKSASAKQPSSTKQPIAGGAR